MNDRPFSVALLALVALAWLCVACQHPQPDRTVMRALVCEECSSGEADSVTARGNSAVPVLLAALTLPAPSVRRAARELAQRDLRRAHRKDSTIVADSAATDRLVYRFDVSYQRRAAYLLRRIGTPEAKHALGTALMSFPQRYPGSLLPESRRYADSLWRSFP